MDKNYLIDSVFNIHTITECFSMEPATWIRKQNFERIEFVQESLGPGYVQFYVGIDKSNNPTFKIRVDCCTITYK